MDCCVLETVWHQDTGKGHILRPFKLQVLNIRETTAKRKFQCPHNSLHDARRFGARRKNATAVGQTSLVQIGKGFRKTSRSILPPQARGHLGGQEIQWPIFTSRLQSMSKASRTRKTEFKAKPGTTTHLQQLVPIFQHKVSVSSYN